VKAFLSLVEPALAFLNCWNGSAKSLSAALLPQALLCAKGIA
jgi:hypothetical protein